MPRLTRIQMLEIAIPILMLGLIAVQHLRAAALPVSFV